MTQEQIEVLNPATGELLGVIGAGSPEVAQQHIDAAVAALPEWRRTAPAERAAMVKEAARRLRDHADELAAMQSAEGGKPHGDSLGGVMAGISTMEQYAELGPLHRGKSLQGNVDALDLMVHVPRGVAALLVPWNDPIAIGLGLTAAALVTGNTVILKPSEKTPLSTMHAVELMDLPTGVLELALGDARMGGPMAASPQVDVVVHVGSVASGREIAAVRGAMGKKTVLELGGKDALIVDRGVDVQWAAEQAALGAFANAGQICTSVERIYVHRDIADGFVDRLTKVAKDYEIGPMVDDRQRMVVQTHVDDAVHGGARVLTGGEVPLGDGFRYPPTVLVDVTDDMQIMRTETFGPVAPVCVVNNFDEALERVNDSEYGLAATVLTPSHVNAQRAIRALQVGTVKINAVFGGAPGGAAEPQRGSGLGYGYGPELLDELTTTKVVHYGQAVVDGNGSAS
jgi:acyl-CoA reductase-like NAD-dependent aldehyde dehydrogenase